MCTLPQQQFQKMAETSPQRPGVRVSRDGNWLIHSFSKDKRFPRSEVTERHDKTRRMCKDCLFVVGSHFCLRNALLALALYGHICMIARTSFVLTVSFR